jgi:hypothetical protein
LKTVARDAWLVTHGGCILVESHIISLPVRNGTYICNLPPYRPCANICFYSPLLPFISAFRYFTYLLFIFFLLTLSYCYFTFSPLFSSLLIIFFASNAAFWIHKISIRIRFQILVLFVFQWVLNLNFLIYHSADKKKNVSI